MRSAGIIGYGQAGSTLHAPLLEQAGWRIASVVTNHPERIAEVGANLPGAQTYSSVEAMLEAGGVDLVVVASPSGVHVDNAKLAIEAGVATVVDKPLGIDAPSALEVLDAARQHEVPLTVFQNRRWDTDFVTLQDLIRRGVLGEVRRTESRFERWRPEPKDRWRERVGPREGGGLMLDLFTHLIDQAVLLHGPVVAVYAEARAFTQVAEDDAFAALHHDNGQVTHIAATHLAAAPGPRWRVTGTDAAYVCALTEGSEASFARDESEGQCGWLVRGGERDAVVAQPGDQAQFYRLVAEALGSPDPQAAMPVDPRDAIHVLAVIDAARVSVEDARVVRVMTPGQVPR